MHFSERGPERHSSAQPLRPDQAMQARAPWSRVMPTVALALVRWVQRALIEPARQRRRRRAQLEALVSLNAHLLADVGLARCDVQAALWGDAPLGRRQGAVELAPLHQQDRAAELHLPRQPAVVLVVDRDRMDSAA